MITYFEFFRCVTSALMFQGLKQLVKILLVAFGNKNGAIGTQLAGLVSNVEAVLQDPSTFLSSLFSAIGEGFQPFIKDPIKELSELFMGWLSGSAGGIGFVFPNSLEPMALLGSAASTLGLSFGHFKELAGGIYGSKVQNALGKLEDLKDAGLTSEQQTWLTHLEGGNWNALKTDLQGEVLDGLKTEIGTGLRDYILVKAGTYLAAKIASLAIPGGNVVTILQSLYALVTTVMGRVQELTGMVENIWSAVSSVAAGGAAATGKAAKFVTDGLRRLGKVLIDFGMKVAGLGKIADVLQGKIKNVRSKVDIFLKKGLERFKGIFNKIKDGSSGKTPDDTKDTRTLEQKNKAVNDATLEAQELMDKVDEPTDTILIQGLPKIRTKHKLTVAEIKQDQDEFWAYLEINPNNSTKHKKKKPAERLKGAIKDAETEMQKSSATVSSVETALEKLKTKYSLDSLELVEFPSEKGSYQAVAKIGQEVRKSQKVKLKDIPSDPSWILPVVGPHSIPTGGLERQSHHVPGAELASNFQGYYAAIKTALNSFSEPQVQSLCGKLDARVTAIEPFDKSRGKGLSAILLHKDSHLDSPTAIHAATMAGPIKAQIQQDLGKREKRVVVVIGKKGQASVNLKGDHWKAFIQAVYQINGVQSVQPNGEIVEVKANKNALDQVASDLARVIQQAQASDLDEGVRRVYDSIDKTARSAYNQARDNGISAVSTALKANGKKNGDPSKHKDILDLLKQEADNIWPNQIVRPI
jgi:hypothetical protein